MLTITFEDGRRLEIRGDHLYQPEQNLGAYVDHDEEKRLSELMAAMVAAKK